MGSSDTKKGVPATISPSTTSFCQLDEGCDDTKNLVVVRYFLDRPGYTIENASARFWKNAPKKCHPADIKGFLNSQGILDCCGDSSNNNNDNKIMAPNQLLVEVYMDSFGAYIVLDVAEDNGICFDFSNATKQAPARIDIRLTDLCSSNNDGIASTTAGTKDHHPQQYNNHCNMSPAGLYAFCMINGLEAAYMLSELMYGSVSPAYVLTYATYAFFVGGLLQLLVGMWEVTRNNIYGATAFSCFGCFWLANGLKLILVTYFPAQIPPDVLGVDDEWGHFIRELYICFLAVVLLKITLTMNKTTTALLGTLIVKLIFAAVEEFNTTLLWIHCILTWLLSFFAGYVFYCEFVNEVYTPPHTHNLYPWNASSADEVFGAPGRKYGLQPKAVRLRLSSMVPKQQQGTPSAMTTVRSIRATQPIGNSCHKDETE